MPYSLCRHCNPIQRPGKHRSQIGHASRTIRCAAVALQVRARREPLPPNLRGAVGCPRTPRLRGRVRGTRGHYGSRKQSKSSAHYCVPNARVHGVLCQQVTTRSWTAGHRTSGRPWERKTVRRVYEPMEAYANRLPDLRTSKQCCTRGHIRAQENRRLYETLEQGGCSHRIVHSPFALPPLHACLTPSVHTRNSHCYKGGLYPPINHLS